MTQAEWITLAIAILGVLHGPIVGQVISSLRKDKAAK